MLLTNELIEKKSIVANSQTLSCKVDNLQLLKINITKVQYIIKYWTGLSILLNTLLMEYMHV